VLKVMFTAIITAMVGLPAGRFGWVDLSLVYLTPTFLGPQIVGGLILGVGFVIGGYCPGTSVVAMATGKVDALVNLAGICAGIFLIGEVWPSIAGFTESSDLGRLTLPEVFHLPMGLIVLLVVLMAVGGFWGAGVLERRFANRPPKENP
jgi:uncharacterized membrane protein YedE/YeeE